MTRLFLFLCAILCGGPVAAQTEIAEMRLLPGWRTEAGTHMAGIELRLAPGWKTYWRRPGEAGIPPAFNWSGSDNLAGARIHWPSPKVFWQAGMRSVGYNGSVVLPVELTPRVAGQPIDLSVAMEFGACLDICVPVSGHASIVLRPSPAQHDARIGTALANRPLTEGEASVGLTDCTLTPTAKGARLTARIAMPPVGEQEDVVFEPSDQGLWVSEPETWREGSVLVAEAEIQPPRGTPLAMDRAGLRTTVIGSRGAVDIIGCD